jgi:hypothetical protein
MVQEGISLVVTVLWGRHWLDQALSLRCYGFNPEERSSDKLGNGSIPTIFQISSRFKWLDRYRVDGQCTWGLEWFGWQLYAWVRACKLATGPDSELIVLRASRCRIPFDSRSAWSGSTRNTKVKGGFPFVRRVSGLWLRKESGETGI